MVNRIRPNSPWPVFVHPDADPPSYWIAHPMGSYMRLSADEVLMATSHGVVKVTKPTKSKWEVIEYEVLRSGEQIS